MYKADDTLMPSADRSHAIGNDQVLQCRSWDKLIAWARRPDHHSCYEMLSEYKAASHRLEQYALCPKESPHYPVMKAYFERYGHRPVFDDDTGSKGYFKV